MKKSFTHYVSVVAVILVILTFIFFMLSMIRGSYAVNLSDSGIQSKLPMLIQNSSFMFIINMTFLNLGL